MHTHSLDLWRHSHVFLGSEHHGNERRVWLVVALTTVTMVAEIVAGSMFGSVALTADGWHMGTHAAALSISGLAYAFARHQAGNPRYSFGTGKFGELAGYTSAVLLALAAIGIAYQAFGRFLDPVEIHYAEAMLVAVVGLVVNLASAWLLGHDHAHHPGDAEGHVHSHPHHADGNRRAAFAHVIADALTSALAIFALLAASLFGWAWIDPLVGVIGAALIAVWSFALIRATASVLLDAMPSDEIARAVRTEIERGDDRVVDLHLWQLGPGHLGAIVSIVSHTPQPVSEYRSRLEKIRGLSHITVEVQQCG
ncbi:cation transporter [Hyphomicrobium nitrativorans NL23]|uniref:Cation transporter n=1 Tax=Hyphomicrobium nitrativorans NL23 TaxID=1029756 RepID=V5SGL7_9HYPH|nr:CDF family Co(II)/Ni(II) efflux transporter DmeF [Hyphomicrobium nitrativorans]AHB49678.1 cation transporter [Hyphomicrobium nitrativorans NL23]